MANTICDCYFISTDKSMLGADTHYLEDFGVNYGPILD